MDGLRSRGWTGYMGRDANREKKTTREYYFVNQNAPKSGPNMKYIICQIPGTPLCPEAKGQIRGINSKKYIIQNMGV